AGARGLPPREPHPVGGGRQGQQALLPEPVPALQALPGPQDALLRRGPFPVLRAVRGGRRGGAPRRVLQQGEALPRGVQPGLHPHLPPPYQRKGYGKLLISFSYE
ncbi:unnamed protein product, partial [Heterosigma akashiwo]